MKDELFVQVDRHQLRYRPSPPPAVAGAPAPGRAEWLPALQTEAVRLCQQCKNAAALPALMPSNVELRYDTLLAEVQKPAFLTLGDYLIDMAGKELLAALCRHLNGLGAPGGINQASLGSELLRVLEPIYRPDTIYRPDDFAELAAILRLY